MRFNAKQIELLESLLDKHMIILLISERNKVYLLLDHHKYLNPRKGAKRLKLFKGDFLGSIYIHGKAQLQLHR